MKTKCLTRVRLLAIPWTAAYQAPPSMGFPRQEYWSGVPLSISLSLLKFMSIELVILPKHLILCCPLLLLPSVFLIFRVFPTDWLCIRCPKYWSIGFIVSSSSEYSGLISFRIDWFDLLAVQGPLKSLLRHHNPKTLVLWLSAFFMVQLSHLYVTTGKTMVYSGDPGDFVGKVMSLLRLSRFVIAFLQRSIF